MNTRILAFLKSIFFTVALLFCNSSSYAGTLDDIGFTGLQSELGAQMPTGAGVPVAQSEANVGTTKNGLYYPDDNLSVFVNSDFIEQSGEQGVSWHANNVGTNFYSIDSIAPGISDINVYTATGWNNDFLKTFFNSKPNSINARVGNHSWVSASTFTDKPLTKMDWVVATDDFIQVVGVNNDGNGGVKDVFGSSMNVIAVGLVTGGHESGTNKILTSVYTSGRTRPHLVVGTGSFGDFTSFASPMVAASAALLVETGKNSVLSSGMISSSIGRNNYILNHAETSEVIRSALMAGANRNAAFENGNHQYDRSSANGLDPHYGAGELNIYNSYHIIAAGEQNSREAGNQADLKIYGFDYENVAVTSSDIERTYRFTIAEGAPREFAATLSWNLQFTGGNSINIGSAALRNLDLAIYQLDIDSGDARLFVQDSTDTQDTTENLYFADLGPGTYELVVTAKHKLFTTYEIDYGLSWRYMANDPLMGDIDLDGAVSLHDLLMIKKNLNSTQPMVWTDGDLNGDGTVNQQDLSLLLQNFGNTRDYSLESALSAAAVPEPQTLVLLFIALGMMGFLKIRSIGNR